MLDAKATRNRGVEGNARDTVDSITIHDNHKADREDEEQVAVRRRFVLLGGRTVENHKAQHEDEDDLHNDRVTTLEKGATGLCVTASGA